MAGETLAPDVADAPTDPAARPIRIVIVDDSAAYAESWRQVLTSRYGDRVVFEAYQDPLKAIPAFGPGIDLLLLDLEMPMLDGRKLATLAKDRGVACRRIVILSGHDAEELHALFPRDSCLCVVNKTEPQQQNGFLMILDSLVKRGR